MRQGTATDGRRATTTMTLLGFAAIAATASAARIDVPVGASVQDAIDAAAPGDEVVLAPGVHAGPVDLLGKAIMLRSEDPSDPVVVAATLLDGGGMDAVVYCWSGEGRDTVLDGLSLTGGFGMSGGGLVCEDASPTLRRLHFVDNESMFEGGGLFALGGAPLVASCRFLGNSSWYGGGVSVINAQPVFVNCVFSGNVAFSTGGGLDLLNDGDARVVNCAFSGNSADRGGAVSVLDSMPLFRNTLLWNDSASTAGPEVDGAFGSASFAHCLVAGSGGSGAWDASLGADLGGNLDADPLLADANGADDVAGTVDDDLRPGAGSPALDAGLDAAVPLDEGDLDGDGTLDEPTPLDLDGKARFVDMPNLGVDGADAVDLGAYELPAPSCAGDLDGDGHVAVEDLVIVVMAWGDCPADGACVADLDGNGSVGFGDLLAVLSRWGACESDETAPAKSKRCRGRHASRRRGHRSW